MDSQNHTASPAPSSIDPEDARRRFLASMGIEDPVAPSVSEEEEEVVLNSQPENLDLPGATKTAPARSRVISYDVKAKPPVKDTETAEPEQEPATSEADVEPARSEETDPEPRPEIEVDPGKENSGESPESGKAGDEDRIVEKQDMKKAEEPLLLSCPKCHGELVLMPQHVGVQGACVWCDLKIVATRSGAGGEVRVFPLFQPSDEKPVEKVSEELVEKVPEESFEKATPAVSETKEDPEESSEIDEMVSRVKMDPASACPVPEEFAPGKERDEEAEAPADDWGAGFGDAPSDPSPAEENPGNETASADVVSKGFEDSVETDPADPFDGVADLPAGFGAAAVEEGKGAVGELPEAASEEIPDGFGVPAGFSGEDSVPADAEETPKPAFSGEPAMPTGFGNDGSAPGDEAPKSDSPGESALPAGFASGFSLDALPGDTPEAPAAEKEEESAMPTDFASSWGASAPSDEAPAGFSDSPFAEASPAGEGSTPMPADSPGNAFPGREAAGDEEASENEASGFSEPTPWGPPTRTKPEETPTESEGAPGPMAESMDFGSGFAATPPKTEPAAGDAEALWGSAEPADEPTSWGSAPAEESAEEEPTPDFTSDVAPSPVDGSMSGFGSGFEIPASDSASFSMEMGTGTEGETSGEDSIFSDAGEDPQDGGLAGWGKPEETGSGEAPTDLSPETDAAEPIFGSTPEPAKAPTEKPELFGGKTNDDSPGSLFGSPSDSEKPSGPPPLQGSHAAPTEAAPAKSGNGLFSKAAPQVTSQPLGSKPAKKGGKGLLVLLVIILGLVCGAALASFVLPVDEYVEKARSFMEEKLNKEPEVDPAAFLSEMMVQGSPATEAPGMPTQAPVDAAPQAAPQGSESGAPATAAPAPQGSPAAPEAAPQSPAAPEISAPAAPTTAPQGSAASPATAPASPTAP